MSALRVTSLPRRDCKQGKTYLISSMQRIVLRASTSLEQPSSPMLLWFKLERTSTVKHFSYQLRGWTSSELRSHTHISLFRDGISQSPSTSFGMAASPSFMWPRLQDERTQEQLTAHGSHVSTQSRGEQYKGRREMEVCPSPSE